MNIENDLVKKSSLFDLAKLKKNGFKVGDLLAVDTELLHKLMLHLGRTVRRDEVAKHLVLLTGVSAYTKNPINLFMRGPSSIGKSYNTTQTLLYFPQKDLWMLGGLSPTALVHDYGVLVDRDGEEVDFADKPTKQKVKEELLERYRDVKDVKVDKNMVNREFEEANKKWRERLQDARYIVDLHGKILVFLEPPHIETYNKLRPILSHDKEEISYKFTDKESRGRLRTAHVVLKGWPATIFCSTEERYIEDLATRGFTITPEMSSEKYQAGIDVICEKKALPWKFHQDYDFMLLQGYFGGLKNKFGSLNVAIPYARELGKHYPSVYARSMRDCDHFTALIEISALFHYAQRPVVTVKEGEFTVLATMKDFEYVLGLWQHAEETTVTGLPGHILNFFHKAVEPLSEQMDSFSYEDLTQKYNEVSEQKKSSDTIRKWVKYLKDVGWLDTEPDPNDKRKVLIKVIKRVENSGYSRIRIFPSSFKLENFKKWLEDVEKISEKNPVLLKENLLSDNVENIPQSISDMFRQHYSPQLFSLDNLPSRSDISSEPSKPEAKPIEEKKPEISGFQQSPTIPKTLTVQETLVLLRSSFVKGTNEDFEDLATKASGYSKDEAYQFREKLLDEGTLQYDPEGWLVWAR